MMKTLYKILLATLFIVTITTTVFAQDEEEIEFDPIHKTILPGDGYLTIDEKYEKNSSLYLVGDELTFKSIKLEQAIFGFQLPVNPKQDYTIEFTFSKPKMKTSFITIGTNDYSLILGPKLATVYLENQNSVFSDKKYKMPEGKIKNELVCKIVRSKRNMTFFINDQYLCETQVKNIIDPNALGFVIAFSSSKSEMQLKSIRIDQGPDSDD